MEMPPKGGGYGPIISSNALMRLVVYRMIACAENTGKQGKGKWH